MILRATFEVFYTKSSRSSIRLLKYYQTNAIYLSPLSSKNIISDKILLSGETKCDDLAFAIRNAKLEKSGNYDFLDTRKMRCGYFIELDLLRLDYQIWRFIGNVLSVGLSNLYSVKIVVCSYS